MRLFKAKETERSADDESAAMRLIAITNRTRPASSRDLEESPAPNEPQEREDPE